MTIPYKPSTTSSARRSCPCSRSTSYASAPTGSASAPCASFSRLTPSPPLPRGRGGLGGEVCAKATLRQTRPSSHPAGAPHLDEILSPIRRLPTTSASSYGIRGELTPEGGESSRAT